MASILCFGRIKISLGGWFLITRCSDMSHSSSDLGYLGCHIRILRPMRQRMVHADECQRNLFDTITRHKPEYISQFQARSYVWPFVDQTPLGVQSRDLTMSSNTCPSEVPYRR